MQKLKTYLELSKSGIVSLVLISVLGGYLVGHPPGVPFSFYNLALTLFGVLFLASGSAALNQLQEVKIDFQMNRTKNRPLPSGKIKKPEAALVIGIFLIIGLILLYQVSFDVFVLGISAVILYNGFYTLWWKPKMPFAAIPGAVPGALPILMGFAAADGSILSPGGIYLFALMIFWQMPHFWVLAMKYKDDYKQGGIPTLPVMLGSEKTIKQIRFWSLGYVGLAIMAPLFLNVGKVYLSATLIGSIWILYLLFKFSKSPESKRWLQFFLGVNFSLILFVFAAAFDLWSLKWLSRFLID